MTQPDLPSMDGTTPVQRARLAHEATRDLTTAEQLGYLKRYKQESDAHRRERPIPHYAATQPARRRLAAVAAVPFAAGMAAAVLVPLLDNNEVRALLHLACGFASALALLVGLPLLVRANRNLAGAPDPLLDERELDERGHIYTRAYTLLSLCIGVLPLLAITDELIQQWSIPPQGGLALVIGVALTAVMLPSAVSTWCWQDAPE
jgi:hypothetical protein